MPTALDLEFARRYRALATERLGSEVEEVRIFGSRARGDHRLDSDLDLFVLHRTPSPAIRRQLQDLAWEIATEMDMPYWPSVLAMDRAHFDNLVRLERRLVADIRREGVSV